MRWSRAAAALVALAFLVPAAAAPIGGEGACLGTKTEPANGTTLISVQGTKFSAEGGPEKRPARIVAVGPEGKIRWVHPNGRELDIVWSYDVDPLPNGNVFVTATRPGKTVFYELDPRTQTRVWTEVAPFVDTHDADLLDRHRILVANMRNYNETAGENRDRLLVYNRSTDEVVWEWRFEGRFPRDGGGEYAEDWTHVNDVDRIAPGRYLASVRNFDQVIVVDRSTGEIDLRVGADGNFDVMRRQHNPQYLESESGRPTVLVADSDNDRIVEYERTGGEWTRTWELTGEFAWPRDADRLPSGNTLIVDSRNHRVLEVTPEGEVVWEFYSPWLVYDAERVRYGDEAGGPTIRDLGAEGSYRLSGGTSKTDEELEACATAIREFDNPATVTTPTLTATDTPTGDTTTPGGGAATSDEGTATQDGREDASPGDTADGATARTTITPGQPGFGVLVFLLAVALLVVGVRRRE